jgi:hypothetical protein
LRNEIWEKRKEEKTPTDFVLAKENRKTYQPKENNYYTLNIPFEQGFHTLPSHWVCWGCRHQ